MDFKNKKFIYLCLAIIGLVIVSFLIYNFVGSADTNADKVKIDKIKLTAIDTGTAGFTNDGFDYNDSTSYTKVTGYTAGNDNNDKNRIVRSFDTLKYHFNFSIGGKNDNNDYEERTVNIKVNLPDSIARYVSFDPNTPAGETTHTYSFEGIDTYGMFDKEITLYVLGAPNGTEINPSFEIQESTNTDSNYLVTLGNISGSTYNYDYDSSSNSYSTTSTTQGFVNYMPTIVSSKTANVRFKLLNQENEGQKATYDNKIGRYLTYVLGMEIVGDETSGIKGNTMPNKDDITFNISSVQNGNVTQGLLNNDWAKLYSNVSTFSIDPVVVALPYSADYSDTNKKTRNPGNITLTDTSVKVDGYDITYNSASVNADDSRIPNSEYIFGTYAITVFSERKSEDVRNDITNTLTISNINIKDVAGTSLNVPDVSASITNKYYENVDYTLNTEILDEGYNKLAEERGEGAVSKGTTNILRATFNYKKTLSEQGLKEIIKIDTNAYRFVPINDKDITIKIETNEETSLTENDFEVKFVSGNYKSSNYSVSTLDSRLNSEDLALAQATCPSDISSYSNDQIMNLYGGPCIKANDGVEEEYENLISAKTIDNKEVPISKIIVQTKNGVKLPDNAKIIVEVGVRVRNVSDITQTYQMAVVASSSDNDDVLTYYAPRITNDENSITNPNNYKKTVYEGSNIASKDTDSTWAESLKIVNFTSRQVITVTNKNTDGSMKVNYNANSGTTINYNIKTIINDNNEQVGADDVWYINKLKVYVTLPKELTYVPDKALGTPEVINNDDGSTILVYTLPYTKPNMKISDINFNATLKPTIRGSKVEVEVTSRAQAININNEVDTSYFKLLTASMKIYATGMENVIVSQKIGPEGSVIEKNGEFSYLLGAYNNTGSDVENYTILNILPSNNDRNGSKFSGSYKVKVSIPSTLGRAKVYCSTQEYSKLTNEVMDSNNDFEECDVTEGYVDATAIKIEKIDINANAQMDDIRVFIKTSGNTYEDKYINSFVGGSVTYSQNESNKVETRVISRNISGSVFEDVNEDGIKDSGDKYLKNIPVTLYKLDTENNLTKIDDTTTDDNGHYKFKNLDVGRYKVRANYNKDNYDLTLRYATQDTAVDSDAYKIEEGIVEISNKRTPEESDGIRLTRDYESANNMDIGLILRKSFGFTIDKFITKVDLTYNNTLETHEYLNQKIVKEDVRRSLNTYAKVYYGIKIDNNSTAAGYIKLLNESIPSGAIFDENDPLNKGWFYANGQLQNISLAEDLIEPGESRYLTIALNIPPQTEYRSYVNTVTILDVEQNVPETYAEDTNADSNLYTVGEAITYAGINWHVINVEGVSETEQNITLLADSSTSNEKMGHTSSTNDTYKWSTSLINSYLNSNYPERNSLNPSILIDSVVCDDASGLPTASYGGTLKSEGTCQSNIYNTYKIRLLTENEYNKLSSLTDKSWLYGNGDFWLQNSVFVNQGHDTYGRISDVTIVKNLAKYVSKTDTSIQTGYNSDINNWVRSNTLKEVRPVITISNRNIISE